MVGIRGVSWRRDEILDLLILLSEQRVQDAIHQFHCSMETYKEIARGMAARGHQQSAIECWNKTKGLQSDHKQALLHNNTSSNNRTTCPYYNELHSILRGDPSVKPRSVADRYQLPPHAPICIGLEAPFPSAEGSEELYIVMLEPVEGGEEFTPEEEEVQVPDMDDTNIGSPTHAEPHTSIPDEGAEVSNSGERDPDDEKASHFFRL
ncbi:UNVERIFIED_CONTAM: hypothetical protein K2H54_048188 [Gekko kuhli]